jgi:hypothetical protein
MPSTGGGNRFTVYPDAATNLNSMDLSIWHNQSSSSVFW